MAGDVRQRHMQASYIKVEDEFALMGLGFSEVNESPSAQTSSKRYVNDKANTKRITGYDWTTAFTADQIRSEEAVKHICSIGELQKTGAEAETEYVVVDLDEGSAGECHARMFKVAVEVSSFDNNDGEMAVSGNLLQIGDLVEGTFNTATKQFTAASE